MRTRFFAWAVAGTFIFLALVPARFACAQSQTPVQIKIPRSPLMTTYASGTFDVKLTPQETQDKAAAIGRMSIDKQFHGDLEATSKGEMLASSESNGSAAYVALERVTGTVSGRSGSFVLMHNGTMTRDVQELSVSVVPGSATGQLEGLAGKMTINIVDKKHLYEFEYTLHDGH